MMRAQKKCGVIPNDRIVCNGTSVQCSNNPCIPVPTVARVGLKTENPANG